ncbi:MAG: 30S ribosomal protein S18 [Chloroflexota bacterium]
MNSRAGPPRRREGRPRYFTRRKVCYFCVDKVKFIDYKDVARLRRYVSPERGRIESRRRTGNCATHQRGLALAVMHARHLALLPYTPDHILAAGGFVDRPVYGDR